MNSSYVYFIRPVGMPGPIKIGVSEAPFSRLSQLMSWAPFPLEIITTIPGSGALERNLHECFADDWSHREWFFPSKRLVAFVERLKAGVPVEKATDLSDRRGSRPRNGADMSESDKLCAVYNRRIMGAVRRAKNKLGPGVMVDEPTFVTAIMKPWRGHYLGDRSHRGPQPSPADLAEVDRFLRDPASLARVEPLTPMQFRVPAEEVAPC